MSNRICFLKINNTYKIWFIKIYFILEYTFLQCINVLVYLIIKNLFWNFAWIQIIEMCQYWSYPNMLILISFFLSVSLSFYQKYIFILMISSLDNIPRLLEMALEDKTSQPLILFAHHLWSTLLCKTFKLINWISIYFNKTNNKPHSNHMSISNYA